MTKYTDAQTFGPYGSNVETAHVIIKANGGSVSINAVMSDGVEVPVEGSPFTEDTTFQVQIASGEFSASATGGAVYEWSA